MLIEDAAQKLLNLLPKNDPDSNEARIFCDMAINIAEQIPYWHESMEKLVTLLDRVITDPEFMEYRTKEKEWLRWKKLEEQGFDE